MNKYPQNIKMKPIFKMKYLPFNFKVGFSVIRKVNWIL